MYRIIAILISLAALIFVLYMLFGRNQKQWDEMTDEEQKKRKVLIASGILVFFAGIITALFSGKKK
jgi:uncharacterized membrane protein YfcA